MTQTHPRGRARAGTPGLAQPGRPAEEPPDGGTSGAGPALPTQLGAGAEGPGCAVEAAGARGGTDAPARTKRRFFRAAGDRAAPPLPASRQRPPPGRKRPHISITEGALMGHGAKTHPAAAAGRGAGGSGGAGARRDTGRGGAACGGWALSRLSFSPSVRSRRVVAARGARRGLTGGCVSPPARLCCPLSRCEGRRGLRSSLRAPGSAKVTGNGRSPSFSTAVLFRDVSFPSPSPFGLFLLFVGAFEFFVYFPFFFFF